MAFQATVVQKRLEEAGFEPKLAFGITEVLERDVVDDLETRLVTRDYLDARLAEVRAEMRTEFSKVSAEFSKVSAEINKGQADTRAAISDLRSEMIRWFVGIVGGAALAIVLALLRFAK